MRESGNWEANSYLPRYILPRVDVVQTRDFRLACHSVRQGIPTIYEDHSESYHTAIRLFPQETVTHSAFRLAVATTDAVRDRLIKRGMPPEKVRVAWSGLNEYSLNAIRSDELTHIREQFLGADQEYLVTYAGGLHTCRGIDLILRLAGERTNATFLVLGGHRAHARNLRREVERRGLKNLHVLGYLPQKEVPAFLQASDAVLMPYADPKEARITSPLKFFEYLASGTPIVAARLPELKLFEDLSTLDVEWCGISDYSCFRDALDGILGRALHGSRNCASNREIAAEFTWTQRQRRIFGAAGLPIEDMRKKRPAGLSSLEIQSGRNVAAIAAGTVFASEGF